MVVDEKRKNCCYKCDDRKVGCHSCCKKYKKFKEKLDDEKREIAKERQYERINNGTWGYVRKWKKNG